MVSGFEYNINNLTFSGLPFGITTTPLMTAFLNPGTFLGTSLPGHNTGRIVYAGYLVELAERLGSPHFALLRLHHHQRFRQPDTYSWDIGTLS